MKKKIENPFSPEKWKTLGKNQKKNVWFGVFLEIEQKLLNKEPIPNLTTRYDLLEKETNEILINIYKTKNLQGRELYNALRNIFQEDIIAQKDFHFLSPHNTNQSTHSSDLILILDNLRSAFNVGSIIRTADCIGVKEIYFCGYTARTDHPKVALTGMGAEKFISWKYFKETTNAIITAKQEEFDIIALETGEKAVSLFDFRFKDKTAIVLGNEAIGISMSTLSLCDYIVQIPMFGQKMSLNVGTACAVACFEHYRQMR